MRFWTWIPLFFLMQYSYCGQENPYIPEPGVLTVSVELSGGQAVDGVAVRVQHGLEVLTGTTPAVFEIPANMDASVRVSREAWRFLPADTTVSFGDGDDVSLVFLGIPPGELLVEAKELGTGEPVEGALVYLDDELQAEPAPQTLVVSSGEAHTLSVERLGWTFTPVDTSVILEPDAQETVTFWGEPPASAPALLTVETADELGAPLPGAEILVNGVPQAETTPATLELPSELELTLSVALDGWDFTPADTSFVLMPEAEETLTFSGSELVLAQRVVLTEDFSNINCTGCPQADSTMQWAVGQASGPVVSIAFHGNWPAPFDPFFLYNPNVHYQRVVDFYDFTALPQIGVDGEVMSDPFDGAEMLSTIETRLALEPRVQMALERTDDAGTITVSVSGDVLADPGAGPWRLYLVLYETEVHFEGGNNGQTEFHHRVRHMNLDGGVLGTPVELPLGGSFEGSAPFDPDYGIVVAENLRAMAFIQHSDSKEILEAVVESDGGS